MELSQQVEQDRRLDDEHPGVPTVFAGIQVSARRRLVRFLHEGPNRPDVRSTRDRQSIAHLDVAEARCGTGRFDADRHEQASLCDRDRLTDAPGEPVSYTHLTLPTNRE